MGIPLRKQSDQSDHWQSCQRERRNIGLLWFDRTSTKSRQTYSYENTLLYFEEDESTTPNGVAMMEVLDHDVAEPTASEKATALERVDTVISDWLEEGE